MTRLIVPAPSGPGLMLELTTAFFIALLSTVLDASPARALAANTEVAVTRGAGEASEGANVRPALGVPEVLSSEGATTTGMGSEAGADVGAKRCNLCNETDTHIRTCAVKTSSARARFVWPHSNLVYPPHVRPAQPLTIVQGINCHGNLIHPHSAVAIALTRG